MGGVGTGGRTDRGQSEVLGAILVFGILILFIGVLQLYLVPNLVADHEQDHVNQVETEFADLYTAVTSAAGGASDESATVTLGTRYGIVPVLITPAPKSGSITSQEVGGIESEIHNVSAVELENINGSSDIIERTCGLDEITVRSITYRPNYHEYRNPGEHVVETGVRYKSFPGSSSSHQQRLLRTDDDINQLNFMPFTTGSVNGYGIQGESIAFETGSRGTIQTFTITDDSALTINISARNPAAWERIFGPEQGDIEFDYTNDTVDLTLNAGDYRVRCTPVGINDRPNNEPDSPTPPGTSDEDDEPPFNPVGENDLVYLETSSSGNDAEWAFRNRDNDSTKNVTQVRVPWSSVPGNQGNVLELTKDGTMVPVLIGQGSYTPVPGGWTWAPEERDDVVASGTGATNPNAEFLVIFKFSDGSTESYFVNAPRGGGN